MNKYTFYSLSAAATLLLAAGACTQDELTDATLPEGEYPVVLQATGLSVAATTRATVDGNWQGVTSVGVMINGTVKEYGVTASSDYTSATLSNSTDPHYWTSREDISVTAWWPYTSTDTGVPAVKVEADQSSKTGFEGSDFIAAENKTVQFDDPKLTFSHLTARVTIVLKCGAGIDSVDDATVSLESLNTDNGNPSTITAYNSSDATHEVRLAPQTVTVAEGDNFIVVELDGVPFTYRPDSAVEFKAGYRYAYNVTVNGTELEVSERTISDWDEGGTVDCDVERTN